MNEFKVKKGLIVQGSGSTVLDIQGSQGQLFSVTDSLSGSLFSVSDISGIPILEVFSDNRINLGTFGAEAIKISGSTANITGSITNAISASFLSNGVVSGSSQITFSGISGIPSGLVSGSSQITLSSTNGYSTFSSSIATTTLNLSDRIGGLETSSIGLNTYTSSIKSALEFTGSNVTVKGNLTVKGTTTTVDSTTVEIGDNIISLNGTGATNAGIIVRDATSPNLISGSLLWDTTTDKWMAGPVGGEDEIILSTKTQTLTNKTLNGTLNTITNIGNSSLTNSSITIAGTPVSLGGSINSSTILLGTNVWSGSVQLPSGLVSGSSQITFSGISGIPSGLVSGSSQITISDTTGFGTYINQSLLTTSSPSFTNLTIGSNQVLHAGNYNNYAPTKTGTGATGTWGINITGNAATATNLANGSAGTIPYQTSAGTTAMLPAGTSGYFLKSNNTSAPSWVELSLTDLPDAWVKKSVKVATTTNITLSGTTTIDGVAVVVGDRVLVKNQTTTSQNGIYIVNSSTWTRSTDADTISKLAGTVVNVDSGTSNGGLKFFTKLKTTDTLGTTAVNFYKVTDDTDLSGYVTTSRTLTINGTTYNLSADRSWSVGTVTSVGMSVPTGFSISNSPISTSGTLMLSFASGYSLPTTTSQTNWDTSYTHSQTTGNPHGTTKSDIGLGNVDNTSDSTKSVASAAKLTTARTIGGVSFDGTANINLPGVNTTGNQSTTGNAATATTLQTARTLTIGATGKNFNGSANVAWSLSEIGAQPAGNYAASSHTHDAADITSGTLSTARLSEFINNKYTYQTNSYGSGGGVYMPMVKGGLYTSSTSTVTGRLRIKLPSYRTDMMISFIIDVYEYDTDRFTSYYVSGYNYSDAGATWYNTSAIALADSDNRNLYVRFGADTTNSFQCVSIGETDTSWTYPQVVIRDVMGGYSTETADILNTWTIEFVTTDGVSYLHSHITNQPIVDWSRIVNAPSTFTPSSHTHDDRYYTEGEVGNFFSGATAITGYNKSNWDTAFGWGNHASQSYATTSYVTTQINNLINGAPGALDTLSELASALGNNATFATTVTNSIASKLSLSGGTMTGQILFQTSALNNGFRWDVNSDAAGITFKNTGDGDNNSYFNFFTEDNGNEYFKFSHNTWNNGSFDFMDVKNGVVRTNGNIYVNASQSGLRSAGTNELINGNRVWHAGDFSSTNISNWNTAYGWGDHAGLYIPVGQKGTANGVATLDSSGLIPTTQLPSYIDDVIEAADLTALNALPAGDKQTGKIYVALDTNKSYRWSGSAFIYITSGAVDSVAGKTGVVTLVKGDVGLGNVDNTSDSTKSVASAAKLTTARTIGGVSFDGTANIDLPGVNTTGNQNTTGNAATATKLQTARTLTIGATGKNFDGSANVAWSLSEIGAQPAGNYVTLDTNQTITGQKSFQNPIKLYDPSNNGYSTISISDSSFQVTEYSGGLLFNVEPGYISLGSLGVFTVSGNTALRIYTFPNKAGTVALTDDLTNFVTLNTAQTITGAKTFNSIINFSNNVGGIQGTIGDNDFWRIIGNNTASNAGYLEIATADDGTEPIYVRQYTGAFSSLTRTAVLLDGAGNTSFPGTITAPTFSGNLSGNAATATTLQTARTINGTSFNGSANITTATWGTGRTITIGATGKTVDGSGNVSWTLAEIGAQAALTNPITGTATSGQVAFFNGTTTQTGDNSLFWDNTNKRLGIGTTTPNNKLTVVKQLGTSDYINTAQHYLQFRILNGQGTGASRALEIGLLDDGTGVIQSNEAGVGYNNLLLNPANGNVGIGTTSPSYKLDVNGDTNINGTLTATVKSFIIDHPTKSNKKLQYGVLEGPEHSVYFRGKLKGTNKIILPDYWFALVNEETITVNITPIGDKQNIWVVSTNACEIILESETEINCFYTVFAERKDIDKLVTEFDK